MPTLRSVASPKRDACPYVSLTVSNEDKTVRHRAGAQDSKITEDPVLAIAKAS
jgi:hypothetical protein